MEVKDTNGAIFNNGDSVRVTKDLKVKGTSRTLKRGEVVKNIKLIPDPENIECRLGKATIVIKTCFIKKA
jgi:protein PhnA